MSKTRLLAVVCALTGALAAPTTSLAAQRQASGTVVSMQWSTFTIQTSSRGMGVINAMIAAANRITKADYSYVYGGGHAQAGVASIGIKGPGYNGKRAGYDCSGSVAAVLAGAGVWPAGAGVPADNGIISELLAEHKIARGVGTGPQEVTLWDHPGVHIFMNINGRFFGTSDGGGGNPSQKHGGAGWLSDGAPDTLSHSFHPYHLLPSVLRGHTSYGPTLTLTAASSTTGLQGMNVGDHVRVSYAENKRSQFVARSIAYLGTTSATGILASVASDDSSLQLTVGKRTLTLGTGGNSRLLSGAQVGDKVRVTYTRHGQTLTARTLKILAAPKTAQASGTVGSIAADDSTLTLVLSGGGTLKLTVQDPNLLSGLAAGVSLTVTYAKNPDGTLVLQQVRNVTSSGSSGSTSSGTSTSGTGTSGTSTSGTSTSGTGTSGTGTSGTPASQVVGAITWIDWRHRQITVQATDGSSETFSVQDPSLLQGLSYGEFVTVTYTQAGDGSLTATGVESA